MHAAELISVLERFVATLDVKGIAWCALRHHKSFPRPRSPTGDIDLLVGCTLSTAQRLLFEAIPNCGIGVGHVIVKSGGTLRGIHLTRGGSAALHVDLFSDVAWLATPLVDANAILRAATRKGSVRAPNAGHEAAVSLFSNLFHRGFVKHAYRGEIRAMVRAEREAFVGCLEPIWGTAQSEELARRAENSDWDWFARWVPGAKRRLLLRELREPLTLIARFARIAAVIGRRLISPEGVWVALLGPDGAGKTTLLDEYRTRLEPLFDRNKQRHFHWRPRLLPAPGVLAGRAATGAEVTDPHGRPPHGPFVSRLRLVYFWIDYILGYALLVRPQLARGGLVTFDRYYEDFLVDPLRFRMKLSKFLIRFLGKAVPRPDLIFILYAPANVLQGRKQELDEAETQRQLGVLASLCNVRPDRYRLIDVNRSIDAIVDDIERETLRYLNERFHSRRKNRNLRKGETSAECQ